ncbi:MAG TPA: hypothetical protein DHW22_05380 [Planctomycetaceae bacterium]|nr:hypothetical protein [Planctomycetaceae bacterium]
MAVDPYAPCPCGSGKKLKFCCSDLAADIEKVHKMVAGKQPHAALKHVVQLLEQQPSRASLLDLRVSIELSLHEFDAAQLAIETYLSAHPESAAAHAQQAILSAATQSGSQAIPMLQNALERLDDEMPLRVLEAIGAVGQALLMEGQLVAARAHLLLYAAIAPSEDNQALELLLRMNLQSGLPLIMREYLLLQSCPESVPWRATFEEASRFAARGLWRKAESILLQTRESAGAVPEVVYNLALTQGWLGNIEGFAAGLHEYAHLDVPQEEAVEAEALSQLVDPALKDPHLETIKRTYTVGDVESLGEQLRIDGRAEEYPLEIPPDEAQNNVRPRSTHVLLDRPTPSTGVDIQRKDIPHVIAFLSVYGKRTDREALLEVTTDRNESLSNVEALLHEIAEDSLGASTEEEVVAEKSISEESLSWRWRLPDDTPVELRRTLLAEERRDAILLRWTAAPRAALKGKSPQAAVEDPELRIGLLASALIIEQAAVDPEELSLFATLREQLKLPQHETIDPQGVDLEHLPLVRIPRLQFDALTDEQLAKLLDRTVMMGANFSTLLVAEQLASRSAAPGQDVAYRQLIRLEPNYQKAQQWAEKARVWSKQQQSSLAEWVLLELELSIQRGDSTKVQKMLGEIRANHLDEPGVAESTYRLLHAAGLIASPDGQPAANPTHLEAPPVAAEPSAIWTPGNDVSPPATEQDEKQSAIWTP